MKVALFELTHFCRFSVTIPPTFIFYYPVYWGFLKKHVGPPFTMNMNETTWFFIARPTGKCAKVMHVICCKTPYENSDQIENAPDIYVAREKYSNSQHQQSTHKKSDQPGSTQKVESRLSVKIPSVCPGLKHIFGSIFSVP